MSTTIESLELEILSSSKSAESGLDKLTASLEKLKNATKGGVGLGAVANQIKKVRDATDGISGADVDHVTGLAKAIQLLGGTKISSTIATQITAMSAALSKADFTGGSEKMMGLVDALAPLSSLPKTNLTSLVKNITRLQDALNTLDTRTLYTKVQSLTRIMRPLADEMQKVANGFSAFPSKIQKLITNTDRLTVSNNKASRSYINLWAKLSMAITGVKRIASHIASAMKETTAYYETVNLFSVSMGKYAVEAYENVEKVSNLMGIDPAEWMRFQGTIMTLATGFGIASDRAYTMSQQLTQLAYDISSFRDLGIETAMQKIQSGFAGELEPLRAIGYDLSQAKLEAVALSLGIDKSVSSMTQAEKAQLRYYAIMTQVVESQKDMSKTLDSPANQLRIFKAQVTQTARAIGSIFIPALNAVLPYAIAVAKVVRVLAESIASLFGFEMPEVKYPGVDELASGAENVSGSFDDASESAKKLKSYMLGFDELNVINPDEGKGSGLADTLEQFDFELPTYDFIGEATEGRVAQIVDGMKEWLGLTGEINSWADLLDTKLGKILTTVGLIATGFAAWKVAKVTQKAITALSKINLKKINLSFGVVGLTTFLSSLDKFKDYLDDFLENGASISNVSGMLAEFAGSIGGVLVTLGETKTGAAFIAVQGIGEIVSAISDMSQKGINFENITDAIRGMSNLGVAIGLFTGHLEITGVSLIIRGFTDIIHELAENWSAIKNGDWSGVEVETMVLGVISVIGGVATAIIGFNKIKGIKEMADAAKTAKEVATVTESVSTTTSTLTTKLTGLVKNLGLGIAIIAEVTAAAALLVGGIWLLGVELEKVGVAWEPVIDNAGTIAIAVGTGTALLVGIGATTAALGKSGKTLIIDIGLGTAILAEVGLATTLFLAEIWAVGKLLDEIGQAWQPVFDNGENIAKAIGIGAGILVGVGVAAALLGVATTATAGTIPLAIGIGTAMLLELGVAAGLFLAEILVVGKLLGEIGQAWQPVLDDGENIGKAIEKGTTLLVAIGVASAALGVATIASGLGLPLAIAAGAGTMKKMADAFGDFSDSLSKVANDVKSKLAPSLSGVNKVLPSVKDDMSDFVQFMKSFAGDMVAYTTSSAISGISATVDKFVRFFTADPIKSVAHEVDGQYDDMVKLRGNLNKVLPIIKEVTELMDKYITAMSKFNKTSGANGLGGIIDTIVNTTVEIGVTLAKKGWDTVSKFVGSAVDVYTTLRKNGWSTIGAFVGTGVKVGVELVQNGWKTVKGWLGDLTATLGIKLPKIGINWGELEILGATIKYPKGFYTYAQGGFPDLGQMFIAREAGPELVGTIGNRNAVVNNDQIVESVSAGVYQAVLAALGSGGDEGGETQIVINLDGEKIYENQQRVARGRGYNLGMGAFSFG